MKDDSSLKVLVTGASGYLGGVIQKYLSANGVQAVGTTHPGEGEKDLRLVAVDLIQDGQLAAFSRYLPIEAIVHTAALLPGKVNDEEILIRNQQMTMNLVRWAIAAGVRYFLQTSSCAVYGERNAPSTERTIPSPRTLYAVSKLSCETLAYSLLTAEGISSCVFRLSAPYGPAQQIATVVKNFLSRAICGEEISVWGSGKRTQNFVYEQDIAQAVLLALSKRASGVYNISGEKSVSMRELAGICLKVAGDKGGRIAYHGEDPQERHRGVYPCDKARRLLGYSPISLLDGLARTAVSMRKQCE